MSTLLILLAIWCVISVPVSLLAGAAFAAQSNTNQKQKPEFTPVSLYPTYSRSFGVGD